MLLKIKDLWAGLPNNSILKGLNLEIEEGAVHAIMGPNGSGKSTLARVLAGHPDYQVTQGSIHYEVHGQWADFLKWSPEERVREGFFLSFQHPTELPGILQRSFLHGAFRQVAQHQGAADMDPVDFYHFLEEKMVDLGWEPSFLERQVNVGFSGGQKKLNELLQMFVLNPRLCVLDEMDSGLDVDALKVLGRGLRKLRDGERSFVIITHYERILEELEPDYVHILSEGQWIASGGKELAHHVDANGYDDFLGEKSWK